MKIEQYLDNLKLDRWFTSVFDKRKTAPKGKKIKIDDNLSHAVQVWENNFDRRCDEWEKLRVRVIENDNWLRDFEKIRQGVFDRLGLNDICTSFLKILSDKFGIQSDQFISELPAIGAWGEYLLGIESGYYSIQLRFYQNGLWVCGYSENELVLY